MAKKLTSNKAKEILHDKSVHGHPLTDKQRRFFGAIAGGAKPYEDGGWLDKYEQGGLILKKKTKDNYGTTPNANAGHSTANEGWIGEGTTNRGFDYNGAWGGTMQDGGILGKTFLQPNDPKLPKGWNPEAKGYSTEYSTTIGKDGQYYLVPGFKHGKLLSDPEREFHNTGEMLGGPFKTIQSAEDFANRRHKYVEKGKPLPSPMKTYDEFAVGGSMPGSVGFMYARTQNPAPANGKYTKKTLASAQNGQEMKFYQEGLDFKPKSISQHGTKKSKKAAPLVSPYEPVDASSANVLRNLLPVPLNVAQAAVKTITGDARLNETSLSDDQKLALWNTIQNARKRSGVQTGGGTEYIDYGGQGYGEGKYFKKAFERGDVGPVSGIYNSLTNPAFVMASTVGRGRYWTDPRNPEDINYTDVYDWNTHEKNYKGTNTYQIVRNAARASEDKDLNKKKNDMLRMNVHLTKKEIDDIKERNEMKNMSLIAFDKGGVIKDDRGQWAHPGKVTEISSPDITMQGVDYPVLGISDTGDTKMMKPGQDYKFDGKKVTEFPMAQDGNWLEKYATEPMRQDATRNVIPRKMTGAEKKEAAEASKKAIAAAKVRDKRVMAERQKNIATEGDINTPGSWHLEDKLRLFPESVGGVGEMIDEYMNPAKYLGSLTDALGESIANRDPIGVGLSLAGAAGAGALGLDPLGEGIKTYRGLVKPTFTSSREALDYLNSVVDNIGDDGFMNLLTKKTGKSKEQLEEEFTKAIGSNSARPKDPDYIIRQATILKGNNLPKLPKLPKSLKELDEEAGKLVYAPGSTNVDQTEIINRANEFLEKGVGIKKTNTPVKLEPTLSGSEVKVKVNNGENSGYMMLQPNFSKVSKSQTFTNWLKGKEPETKFVTSWGEFQNEPAFTKTSDFPYNERPDLKGTGIGAEAAEAIKQALEEKGMKLLSSTNHTEEGRLRYLTEFLNDRKKAINTEGNSRWLDAVNSVKENLGGRKVSKKEVKELMNLNPDIDPKFVRFQYKGGGWLNKYK